jgi:hypothetical protein
LNFSPESAKTVSCVIRDVLSLQVRNMVVYQSQLPLQNHMFPSVMYLSKPVYVLNRSMGHLWLYYYFVVLAVALVSSLIAMTKNMFVNLSSARVTLA